MLLTVCIPYPFKVLFQYIQVYQEHADNTSIILNVYTSLLTLFITLLFYLFLPHSYTFPLILFIIKHQEKHLGHAMPTFHIHYLTVFVFVSQLFWPKVYRRLLPVDSPHNNKVSSTLCSTTQMLNNYNTNKYQTNKIFGSICVL